MGTEGQARLESRDISQKSQLAHKQNSPRLGPADEARENTDQSKQRWEVWHSVKRVLVYFQVTDSPLKGCCNDKAESPEKAAPSLCSWTHAFAGKLWMSGGVSIAYLDSDASNQPPSSLTTTPELPRNTYGKWYGRLANVQGLWFSSVGNFSLLGWRQRLDIVWPQSFTIWDGKNSFKIMYESIFNRTLWGYLQEVSSNHSMWAGGYSLK